MNKRRVKFRKTIFGRWRLYVDGACVASFAHLGAAERLCSGLYINEIYPAILAARGESQ